MHLENNTHQVRETAEEKIEKGIKILLVEYELSFKPFLLMNSIQNTSNRIKKNTQTILNHGSNRRRIISKKMGLFFFGDQSGRWGNCPNQGECVFSNIINTEFASKVFEVAKQRDYKTVFIDNIRLV